MTPDEGTESEYLNSIWDGELDDDDDDDEGKEFYGMPRRMTLRDMHAYAHRIIPDTRQVAETLSGERRLALYNTAKAAKVGTECTCPSCAKQFKKKSYQQAFCCNKGANNCKDAFWNRANPERQQRAMKYLK